MKKTIIRRQTTTSVNDLPKELHPILQHVYRNRGVQSASELERGLDKLLPYQQLMGIEGAMLCLYEALQQQQRILIVGDFDADGATSSAVAVSALRALGAGEVHYLVPNRFEYGYGLTPEIVEVAKKWQPDLIITVDNGISSCAGVAAAKAVGIKVLVTDHHLPGAELPIADSIVNPNQTGDVFPSKNLAGVGVIFYVMLALRSYLREREWFTKRSIAEPNMASLLDLVALGTVADVVPLDKNNRILVHQGLQRIRAGTARVGIQALLTVAGRSCERLVAADLGFAIAPRLNAAGRLDDMSLGIECLLCEDPKRAQTIAGELDALNKERRLIEEDMQQQALQELAKLNFNNNELPYGVCLFDKSWHQGVIGILASRLKERLHRPVIAFAPGTDGELKGSARSIAGVHIRDVLDLIASSNPGLISRFGGHAMAAGLALEQAKYTQFAQCFAAEIAKQIGTKNLQGVIESDGELAAADFAMPLAEALREGGPWGQTFPEPLFDGEFRVLYQRLVGNKHLKLTLGLAGQTKSFDAIAFNVDLKQWPNHRCEQVRAAFRLDINEYQGVKNLQLVVEHLEV
ncbi:single-stranded-DNA-specific exonuclease RecJ [soil metagenome]